MTDAISNNNRVKAPNVQTDQRAKSSPKGSPEAANTPASAVVELSSEQVMDQMKRIPEVDSSRVEAIKTALANGDYKPDPEVIAQKFSDIENLLP